MRAKSVRTKSRRFWRHNKPFILCCAVIPHIFLGVHLCGARVSRGGEVHDELRVRLGEPGQLREHQHRLARAARAHHQGVPLRPPQRAQDKRVPNLRRSTGRR